MAIADNAINSELELQSQSKEYRELVTQVIWDCQVIEAGLRRYVTSSYECIRRTMGRSLPFHLDKRDVEKDSMGVLIAKFENLSDDPDLIGKLKSLVTSRNKCAHRGFALTVREWNDADFLKAQLADLRRIKPTVDTCMSCVLEHCKRVKGLLGETSDAGKSGARV